MGNKGPQFKFTKEQSGLLMQAISIRDDSSRGKPYYIDDTNSHTWTKGRPFAFVVLETTVIDTLKIIDKNGKEHDALTQWNFASKSLPVTMPVIYAPVTAGKDWRFSEIKLTSGSVCMIQKDNPK
jgi:hypothetical protein